MATVVRQAPAKLNLTLRVVGRRPDGYHLLDSLVAFTAYGDEIEAAPGDGLHMGCRGPFAASLDGPAERNLVHRAATALARAGGVRPDARITLTKNLPVASGIGGGSSDAAATLLALNTLWSLTLPPEEIAAIGLGLGADVPVCLARHTARLQGIGEIVTKLAPIPAAPIVLVNPGIGLATQTVFKARSGRFSPDPGASSILQETPADAASLARALALYENDLTAAATGLLPVIGDILKRLRAEPDCLLARMSGSGDTCFALFPTDAAARLAAMSLGRDRPGWWTVATNLMP